MRQNGQNWIETFEVASATVAELPTVPTTSRRPSSHQAVLPDDPVTATHNSQRYRGSSETAFSHDRKGRSKNRPGRLLIVCQATFSAPDSLPFGCRCLFC